MQQTRQEKYESTVISQLSVFDPLLRAFWWIWGWRLVMLWVSDEMVEETWTHRRTKELYIRVYKWR